MHQKTFTKSRGRFAVSATCALLMVAGALGMSPPTQAQSTADGQGGCAPAEAAAEAVTRQANLNSQLQRGLQSRANTLRQRADTLQRKAAATRTKPAYRRYVILTRRAKALTARIGTHNANRPSPANSAAVAAYNARARELNAKAARLQIEIAKARRPRLVGDELPRTLKALTSVGSELTQLQSQSALLSSLTATLERQRLANAQLIKTCTAVIKREYGNYRLPTKSRRKATYERWNKERSKVPTGWTPPAIGTIVEGDPAHDLYQYLRRRTVSSPRYTGKLQGQFPPKVGARNPAFPRQTIPPKMAKGKMVKPIDIMQDHILPYSKILLLPGFMELTVENMDIVINCPCNLQWMPGGVNSSKGNKSASTLAGVDPSWLRQQLVAEKQALIRIRMLIAALLQAQRNKAQIDKLLQSHKTGR